MFTFLTISYNQEKYIIEHLESIKYQILNFGNRLQFQYIISDDCSTDNTIFLVNEWVKRNKFLFEEIIILTNSENKGIVSNYLKGISSIVTNYYKSLAGDDLYYRNNIFEVIEDNELVFTPVIRFGQCEKIRSNGDINFKKLIRLEKIEEIKKRLTFGNLFDAPGAFMKTEIIQDKGLMSFLSNYSWIEDLPQWYYIFKNVSNLKLNIKEKPYILYRTTDGISNKRSKHNQYNLESLKIMKQFYPKSAKYPKYINPYKYYSKFQSIKIKYFDSKMNLRIKGFTNIMKEERKNAPKYLTHIRNEAYNFYKQIGEEQLYDYKPIIESNNSR